MKLVIVESPAKTKTIKKYLGDGWIVDASIGHIRDLPDKSLGVDVTTLLPTYVATERGKDRIAKLKAAAAKADEVYLATDPDREGEAIAWHLQEALGLKDPKRITFNEITEKAVKAAVASPRSIDMHLVKAQEARRVLDRLVGYPCSQAVAGVLGQGKSVGRVQSPAVKIVVLREEAIENFKVTTHYGAAVTFEALEHVTTGWQANWLTKSFLQDGQEYILDKMLAEKVAAQKYYIVKEFVDTQEKKAPSAPFTTSVLQRVASSKLKLSPKVTMQLAQKLFDGGHITYLRTDSPNLSEDAIAAILEYCRANNLPVMASGRKFKVKGNAQEAHEAIRPTHIDIINVGETPEEQALYTLIRLQAIASQMADAEYAVRKVTLQSEDPVDGKPVVLTASGRVLTAAGWQTIFKDDVADDGAEETESDEQNENAIPELRPDSRLLVQSTRLLTKQTKPPSRFTDGLLVAQLEKAGIGRPATYAAILNNIIESKGYLEIDKKRMLRPTAAGRELVAMANDAFCFMDLDFTKDLELDLDDIAEGKKDYNTVVFAANTKLLSELKAFNGKHSYPCPDCGKPLMHRQKAPDKKGKGGYDFWGCSGYPECSYNAKNDAGKVGAKIEKKVSTGEVTAFKCPKCKSALVRRKGKSAKGDYDFFGCKGFPKCKESFNVKNDAPDFDSKK